MLMKKVVDIAVSVSVLIVLSPVLIALTLLVFIIHGWPIVFVQERPGLQGKPFLMYKFRSMTNATDTSGALLPPEERITRFGKFIRATSLDELPEFYNVLRGEMSLVGPRPLRMEYLERYTPGQMRRHEVRPGITGWAQIHGRNDISWEDKFRLDVWYVDNWSLMLDFRILLSTVGLVLSRKGIAPDGAVIMTEFMGSDEGAPETTVKTQQ